MIVRTAGIRLCVPQDTPTQGSDSVSPATLIRQLNWENEKITRDLKLCGLILLTLFFEVGISIYRSDRCVTVDCVTGVMCMHDYFFLQDVPMVRFRFSVS